MPQSATEHLAPDRVNGEPAWEIAHLFPPQGSWTEEEYLALNGSHLVEFCDGRVEVLSMPSTFHQRILGFLYRTFFALVETGGLGWVLFSPLRVKLWEGRIREPDLVVLLNENKHLYGEKFWRGADLAIEIVSDDDPDRDLRVKRAEYARAGIREYWIVDPRDSTIRVLTLQKPGDEYREVGLHAPGDRVVSVLLPALAVAVDDVFSQPPPKSGESTTP